MGTVDTFKLVEKKAYFVNLIYDYSIMQDCRNYQPFILFGGQNQLYIHD